MNREESLARHFCRILDRGAEDLDPAIAERLRASRARAVGHCALPAPAGVFSIVGAGATATGGDDGHPLRAILAALALVAGIATAYYWNGFEQADANEAIDIALLSDDLPPGAYLDPGFQAWISHYAQSSR